MFLRARSTQAEYFDTPGISQARRVQGFCELDRLNRLFRFDHPFSSRLPRWLGKTRCVRLDILDVGAGTGLLGARLSEWARRRGWEWRFTNLDLHPVVSGTVPSAAFVAGSALQLPFADGSFDLVVASQMTHHLNDAEVVQHWREAWRVTRDGLFVCDLHRNAFLYGLLWLTTGLLHSEPELRADGLISVRRGFRIPEWRALADRAQIPRAEVRLYYGTRIVLQARKGARCGR